MNGAELGRRLAERDLTAAPAALNLVENRSSAARPEIAELRSVHAAADTPLRSATSLTTSRRMRVSSKSFGV